MRGADMRRGRFRQVVELSLLKAVQPDLLLSFLRPFAPDLAHEGLAMPGSQPSTPWLIELTATLNRKGTDLPAGLQAALTDITDLATPVGHEHIMTLADERGVALVAMDEAVSQEDLAFRAYLRDPDLFRAARSRVRSFDARLFVEYDGQQQRSVYREGNTDARLAALHDYLAQWLQRRNRGGTCHVWAEDLQDQVVFLVAHAAASTTAVEFEHGEASAPRVPEQHDLIVFHKHEDRLSVSARFPGERELYRAAFGRLLFGDEAYFRVVRLYHSRPFRERGSLALDVSGVEGLERVTLKNA